MEFCLTVFVATLCTKKFVNKLNKTKFAAKKRFKNSFKLSWKGPGILFYSFCGNFVYKKFVNKLNETKFAAKKRFLQQFDQNKSNPHKTWEVINSLLTNSKFSPTLIKVKDNVFDAPSQIAKNFNNCFCNNVDNLINTCNSNYNNHSFFSPQKLPTETSTRIIIYGTHFPE